MPAFNFVDVLSDLPHTIHPDRVTVNFTNVPDDSVEPALVTSMIAGEVAFLLHLPAQGDQDTFEELGVAIDAFTLENRPHRLFFHYMDASQKVRYSNLHPKVKFTVSPPNVCGIRLDHLLGQALLAASFTLPQLLTQQRLAHIDPSHLNYDLLAAHWSHLRLVSQSQGLLLPPSSVPVAIVPPHADFSMTPIGPHADFRDLDIEGVAYSGSIQLAPDSISGDIIITPPSSPTQQVFEAIADLLIDPLFAWSLATLPPPVPAH